MGSKRDDDEKAVEELLCEAMDMVILEQVAAINNLPHASSPFKKTVAAEKGEQTVKKEKIKLEQYEKRFSQYTNESPKKMRLSSPSKSSDFGRLISRRPSKRGRFWCWRRASRGKYDEILCDDLSKLSLRKMVEKARTEEEKICVEAEKVIKWVNHASAEMDAYII